MGDPQVTMVVLIQKWSNDWMIPSFPLFGKPPRVIRPCLYTWLRFPLTVTEGTDSIEGVLTNISKSKWWWWWWLWWLLIIINYYFYCQKGWWFRGTLDNLKYIFWYPLPFFKCICGRWTAPQVSFVGEGLKNTWNIQAYSFKPPPQKHLEPCILHLDLVLPLKG